MSFVSQWKKLTSFDVVLHMATPTAAGLDSEEVSDEEPATNDGQESQDNRKRAIENRDGSTTKKTKISLTKTDESIESKKIGKQAVM